MRDFYVFDPQEYDALERAFQRMEGPTNCQTSMAILPPLYIITCNTIILYIANLYRDTTAVTAPIITTSLTATILIVELLAIAFRHHPRYAKIREYMECIICVTLIQFIASGCFIFVLEINKKYDAYLTCIAILSILSILFLMIPFCNDIFTRNRET
jgi:hypothetical protein